MEQRKARTEIGAAVQLLLTGSVLLVAAFAPPPHGRLLLLPISSAQVDAGLVARVGLAHIRAGPVRGSIVADGPGIDLAPALLQHGSLMVAAPAAICGSART
jgi:hypothetical protein